MRILNHVAQRIVNEVTKVIHEEVIVINRDGYIIAASDEKRLDSFHEGGQEVVKTKRKLVIDAEEVKRLRGVKIGLTLPICFQNNIIGAIGITGSKPETTRHGELIQRMTELIIEEAYAAERLDSKLRGLETFISEWLHSESLTDDLRERGEILGVDMKLPRYCVMIQLFKDEQKYVQVDMEADVLGLLQAEFATDQQHHLVRWGSGRFVLLLSAEHLNEKTIQYRLEQLILQIEQRFHVSIGVGCSRRHEYASTMYLAYKEARQALSVKEVMNKVIFYDTLALELILAEVKNETRQTFIKKVLLPITKDQELLETLQAYFSHDLSIKQTAQFLHIHINTLHYRLRRIEELTGYRIKGVKDIVTLYIALLYLEDS